MGSKLIVSGSEVETFQRCPKQHWYAYGLGITPTEKTLPLKHGILGHDVLEAYYRAKKAELPHDECVAAGFMVIAHCADTHPGYGGDVISMVSKRFAQYTEHYRVEPWRILDVEGVYSVPMDHNLDYALTLDLLVEFTAGPYKGQQCIVDHKWTYNFWPQDQVHWMGQLPKYIEALKRLGSTAKFGIVNQIRYRSIQDPGPSSIFRRSECRPTAVRMRNIMDVQYRMAKRIASIKEFPSIWQDEALPSIDRHKCERCFFSGPCNIELDGRDPADTLRVNFKQNTYGYSEEKLRRNLE